MIEEHVHCRACGRVIKIHKNDTIWTRPKRCQDCVNNCRYNEDDI